MMVEEPLQETLIYVIMTNLHPFNAWRLCDERFSGVSAPMPHRSVTPGEKQGEGRRGVIIRKDGWNGRIPATL